MPLMYDMRAEPRHERPLVGPVVLDAGEISELKRRIGAAFENECIPDKDLWYDPCLVTTVRDAQQRDDFCTGIGERNREHLRALAQLIKSIEALTP